MNRTPAVIGLSREKELVGIKRYLVSGLVGGKEEEGVVVSVPKLPILEHPFERGAIFSLIIMIRGG
ncbi:MAG: hypothetical protein SF029_21515 [bacterium]|nr:hypothetical protein [bacterium]